MRRRRQACRSSRRCAPSAHCARRWKRWAAVRTRASSWNWRCSACASRRTSGPRPRRQAHSRSRRAHGPAVAQAAVPASQPAPPPAEAPAPTAQDTQDAPPWEGPATPPPPVPAAERPAPSPAPAQQQSAPQPAPARPQRQSAAEKAAPPQPLPEGKEEVSFEPWPQVVAAMEQRDKLLYASMKGTKAYYDGRRVLIDGSELFLKYMRQNAYSNGLLKDVTPRSPARGTPSARTKRKRRATRSPHS